LDFVNELNRLSLFRVPFLVIFDFELKSIVISKLDELEKNGIRFEILQNLEDASNTKFSHLSKNPLSFDAYKKKFDLVIEEIKKGNVYLLNLCCKTEVKTEFSLEEIYENSKALMKLLVQDRFVCFTPERFVTIDGDTIYTNPMKGTIKASIEGAKTKLLNDKKEIAEHIMIVDLLRNDLGMVARDIRVDSFRYIEQIGDIYQTSSKISGKLQKSLNGNLGDILFSLLPAGSISGTPKKSALKIIKNIEGFERGFFSGVCGVYDGDRFESFVLIRFLEKEGERLFYKSGGGITLDSEAMLEYQEMIEKIYLPY